MSFWDFLGNSDNSEQKHDVLVPEPSLSGKFSEVGIPGRSTEQRIYASPDTMEQMNSVHPELAGTAAEITGADNVIFVSRGDIEPEIKKVDEAHGLGGMNVMHNEQYPYYVEAFDGFRQKFEDPPPLNAPGSAMDAYNEDASSSLHIHENGQSYAVITLPDLDQSADEHFRNIANIKAVTKKPDGELVKTIVHIPSSEELDKATIASDILHEAGHSGLRHSNADADAAQILHQEQQADSVSAVATPYLFPNVGDEAVQLNQEARAVGAMLHSDHDHDTNLDLHRDPAVTTEQQLGSINAVHQAVTEQVAKDIGTDIEEAKELLDGDPQLRHATLNKLNQIGVFSDDPVAQEYVSDYMKAGVERVPEYLGVSAQNDAITPQGNNIQESASPEINAPMPVENNPTTLPAPSM